MRTGILLLNFGEPERPVMEEVVPFLERIFLMNGGLEPGQEGEARRLRARELAERRAPPSLARWLPESCGTSISMTATG